MHTDSCGSRVHFILTKRQGVHAAMVGARAGEPDAGLEGLRLVAGPAAEVGDGSDEGPGTAEGACMENGVIVRKMKSRRAERQNST